ncbi:MAG: glycosyltransferase, partial [Sphingobacteriales bacterium]
MIFWIFTITLIFTGLIYSALIIFSLRGWNRLPAYIPSAKNASGLKFSIIIPARNEENNIVNCVEDIINQQFDKSCFEIIVVDDFSEDLTFEKVNSFKKNHPEINLHIIQLEKMLPAGNHNSYKKLAIAEGIKTSKNEWIITTDADC